MSPEQKIARLQALLDQRWSGRLSRTAQAAVITKPVLTSRGSNAATVSSNVTFKTLEWDSLQDALRAGMRAVLGELKVLRDEVEFKFKKMWAVPMESGLSLFALLDLSGDYYGGQTETMPHNRLPGSESKTDLLPGRKRGSEMGSAKIAGELVRLAKEISSADIWERAYQDRGEYLSFQVRRSVLVAPGNDVSLIVDSFKDAAIGSRATLDHYMTAVMRETGEKIQNSSKYVMTGDLEKFGSAVHVPVIVGAMVKKTPETEMFFESRGFQKTR
jgi:hypothetical protein